MKFEKFFSDDPFELITLLEELKKNGVDRKVVEVGLSRAREVLFRDIRSVNPTGEVFYPGDDTVVKNKSKVVNIWTRMLIFLTSKVESLPDGDLVSLFGLLKSEDDLERTNVSQSIMNLYDGKVNQKKILELLDNEFQLFHMSKRTHIWMNNVLEIYSYSTKGRDVPEEEYFQNVLLFMKSHHLDLYLEFKVIVLGLCKDDPYRSLLTTKYIFRIFEDVPYLSRVYLVEILTTLVENSDIKEITPGLCTLINKCLESTHYLLIEEALGILEVPGVTKAMDEILPRVFDSLYTLSKKYWRKKGMVKVIRSISLILNMSHEIFERCLINYNRRKYNNRNNDDDNTNDDIKENYKVKYDDDNNDEEKKFNKRRKSTNNHTTTTKENYK